MYGKMSVSEPASGSASLLERIASSAPKILGAAEYAAYIPIVAPRVIYDLARISARLALRKIRREY